MRNMDKTSCGEAPSRLLLLPQELLAAIVDGLPRASRASLAAASKYLRLHIYINTRRLGVTLQAEPARCSQLDNGNSDAATLASVSQLLPLLPCLELLVIRRAAQVWRCSAAGVSPGLSSAPVPYDIQLGTGRAPAAGSTLGGPSWASATAATAPAAQAWGQLASALDAMAEARLQRHSPGTISCSDTCHLKVSVNALPGFPPPSSLDPSHSFTTKEPHQKQQQHQRQGQQEVAHAYAWLRHLQHGRAHFRASLTAMPAPHCTATSIGAAAAAARGSQARRQPVGCTTCLPFLHTPERTGTSSYTTSTSPPPLIIHAPAAATLSPNQATNQHFHPTSPSVEILHGLMCLQTLALTLTATPYPCLSIRYSPPPSPPQPPATPPALSQRAAPWPGPSSTATSRTSVSSPTAETPTTRSLHPATTYLPSCAPAPATTGNPHPSSHRLPSLPLSRSQLLEASTSDTPGARRSLSYLSPYPWWPYLLPHLPHLSMLHLELPPRVAFDARAAEALAAAAPSLRCLVLGGDAPPPEALRGISPLSRLHTLDLRPASILRPSFAATAVPQQHVFTPDHAAACAALPGLRHLSVQHLGVRQASDRSSGSSRSGIDSADPFSTGSGRREQQQQQHRQQQHPCSRHPASAAHATSGIMSLELRGCVLGAGRSSPPPLSLLFPSLTLLTLHKLPSLPQTWHTLLGGSSSGGTGGLVHLQQLVLLDPWPLAQELRLLGDVLAGTYQYGAEVPGVGARSAVVGAQANSAAAGPWQWKRPLWEGEPCGGGSNPGSLVMTSLQRLHVGCLRNEETAVAAVQAAARLWPRAAAVDGGTAGASVHPNAVLSLAFDRLSSGCGWRCEMDQASGCSTALPPLARALACCRLTGLVVGVEGACGEEWGDPQLQRQEQCRGLLEGAGCGAVSSDSRQSGHGECSACCGGRGGGGRSSGLSSMVLESLVAALPYMGPELGEMELRGFGSLGVCDASRLVAAMSAVGTEKAAYGGGAQRCGISVAEASEGQGGIGVGLEQGPGVAGRVLRLVQCGCRVCGPCGAHGVGVLRAQGVLFGLAQEHGVRLELVD